MHNFGEGSLDFEVGTVVVAHLQLGSMSGVIRRLSAADRTRVLVDAQEPGHALWHPAYQPPSELAARMTHQA